MSGSCPADHEVRVVWSPVCLPNSGSQAGWWGQPLAGGAYSQHCHTQRPNHTTGYQAARRCAGQGSTHLLCLMW
jgi:hypothetical protein